MDIPKNLFNSIKNIQQSRSNFQLEHFVVGQHATPAMQYYQICIELEQLIYTYEKTQLSVKKSKIKIKKYLESNDEIKKVKAAELELDVQRTEEILKSTEREINFLITLWEQFPIKYSREDIELDQPTYWRERLSSNIKAELMSGNQVSSGYIEALQNMGALPEELEKYQELDNPEQE